MFKKARQLLSKALTGVVKFLLNRYRPHPGAGIKLEYLSIDYYHARMRLKLKWCNRNYFGTQFGGLLFAMMDAPYALMLTQILDSNYIIWDKKAEIEYIKPGRTDVYCQFELTTTDIDSIKQQTAQHGKLLWQKTIDIVDSQQNLIAKATRTLYVRDKRIKQLLIKTPSFHTSEKRLTLAIVNYSSLEKAADYPTRPYHKTLSLSESPK